VPQFAGTGCHRAAGMTVGRVWNCTYAKAPVPRIDGDRALFSLVLRERIARGNGYQWGRPCPLPSQRSYFKLLAVGLPGPTGTSPSQSSSIRTQNGSSFTHCISASFRNPLGSRTISMPSVQIDLQSPMTHLGRCGAVGFAAFLDIAGSGSHVLLLAPCGLHEGAQLRRDEVPPCGTTGAG
jgi:hypothetical protein